MTFKKLRFISIALATTLALVSCNPSSGKYEELIEPVSDIPTFRSVGLYDIGKPELVKGLVKGTEYCHFYKKNIKLKSINVSIGQYVEEGDILCEADIDAAKSEVEDLQKQLAVLNAEHSFLTEEYDLEKRTLELSENYAEYNKTFGNGTQADIEAAKNNISIAEENYNYEELLYQFKKDKINESISQLNEIVTEGVIRARHSGYVTYVKDLKGGLTAGINENVVIVTDYDDLYIESELTVNNYKYSKYEVKCAIIGNEKEEVIEYDYTEGETAYSRAQSELPKQRFKMVSYDDLKIGETILMLFYEKDNTDVIAVGKDSIKADEDGSFVYVKNANGELEKRHIETGESDDHYTEVTSGLSVGELVLYTQEAMVPEVTQSLEVNLGCYYTTESIKGVKRVENFAYAYANTQKGEIAEIYVNGGDEVKKGDPLFKIIVDPLKSPIVEVQNQITGAKRDHENFLASFSDSYESISKEKNECKNTIDNFTPQLKEINDKLSEDPDSVDGATMAKKSTLEDTINRCNYTIKFDDLSIESLELEKRKEQVSYDNNMALLNKRLAEAKKNNDGSGFETVYAKEDGTAVTVNTLRVGDMIDAGTVIVKVVQYSDDLVRFGGSSAYVGSGYQIRVIDEDDTFVGECVAPTLDVKPNYFTLGDKVYGTFSSNSDKSYVARIEDPAFYNRDLSEYKASIDVGHVDNFVVVPQEFVFTETDFEGKKSNYVWKEKDGNIYKDYVLGVTDGLGQGLILSGVEIGDVLVR